MKGAPGTTHCGHWTPRTPPEYFTTRVVCNRRAGHRGPHRNSDGYQWVGDETPRRPQ